MRSHVFFHRVVRLLKTYQLDPIPFLAFLTETHSLAAGPGPLSVFLPDLFDPEDQLNLYCHVDKLDTVAEYVKSSMVHEFSVEVPDLNKFKDDFESRDIYYKRRFVKTVKIIFLQPNPSHTQPKTTTIKIFGINDMPLLTAVSCSHTSMMNVITGKGIICMYPFLTLDRRGFINRRPLLGRNEIPTPPGIAAGEYVRRGFFLCTDLHVFKSPAELLSVLKRRKVKDIETIAVAFPPSIIGASSNGQKDVLTDKEWELLFTVKWTYTQ